MTLSLKPEHLKRYRDLAQFLIRYGRSDLVRHAQLDSALTDEDLIPAEAAESEALAADLERMGPTFIKLGQLLSSRPDILPPHYTEALSRLQDRVAPFPFAEVERIITDELGSRIGRLFLDIDPVPVAAASLGQVHRATLRSGRAVVVEVQRPGIRAQVADDLEVLSELAQLAEEHTEFGRKYGPVQTLDELRRSLIRELDYLQEAMHLATLRSNLREFERIVVPEPIDDYTTSRVLTMEYVPGRKITALSPLARAEIDGTELADQLFQAYLKQILVDGFFHADPHPGNLFLTPDGRIALIDLGMIGRITRSMQGELLRLVLAVSEGCGDEVADVVIRTGEMRPAFDEHGFRREIGRVVARYQGAVASQIQLGRVVMEIRVKVDEELWMMASLQEIANRITLGLVVAALIIGAAMLMRVETDYTILGYPALAMVFFLIAAVSGLLLAVSIVRHDPKAAVKHRART
jgi:ubiquinone biosynthesis protein